MIRYLFSFILALVIIYYMSIGLFLMINKLHKAFKWCKKKFKKLLKDYKVYKFKNSKEGLLKDWEKKYSQTKN